MRQVILLLVLSILTSLAVKAEDYTIKLKGDKLKNVSAFEIRMGFFPENSFVLSEDFSLEDESSVLFKTVDPTNKTLRVFFIKALDTDELSLHGALKRNNYSGEANVNITSIDYISDFSKDSHEGKLQSELILSNIETPLPYMGISKAVILGPEERFFNENMFIAVTDIETYGFSCNKSIKNPRINGQKAKFISDEIIATTLTLNPEEHLQELEIILELDVENQTISKKIGLIKLRENPVGD